MGSYGTRVNSRRNRTKSKKDNSKRNDYLRTQKGNGRQESQHSDRRARQ